MMKKKSTQRPISEAFIKGNCTMKDGLSDNPTTNAIGCTCKKYRCIFKKISQTSR